MGYGMTLRRPALVAFDGNKLTDHNRSPVSESVERIGGQTRTAKGALRRYHVADKKTFSVSWEFLPGPSNKTADGFWGADAIIAFFNATPGEFTLTMVTDVWVPEDGQTPGYYEEDSYTVLFDDFDYSVEKRWSRYFYDLSLSLEEV